MTINRRQFVYTALSAGMCAAFASPSVLAQGNAATQCKTGFITLGSAVPTNAPGKVEVIEFFAYWCPHCNEFEPKLHAWEKGLPKDVVLKRMHIAFDKSQEHFQRLYFVLEALNKLPELHTRMFDAIHKENNRFRNVDAIAEYLDRNKLIDKTTFMNTYESFSVVTKVQQANALARSYQIDGVPTLGVQGQYRTSGSVAGGNDNMLKVVDCLIDASRPAKAAKKGA